MSETKPCPNCSSRNLYRVVVNAIGMKGGILPIGILHGPRYENVICGDCGLTQWFVAKGQLYLLKEHLESIPNESH